MNVRPLRKSNPMGTPGIGLDKQARQDMIKELEVTLADTFMIMIKTQGVHWNVTGSSFFSVHNLTEEHYKALFEAIDNLAERIRTLGGKATASYNRYMELTSLKETDQPAEVHEQLQWLIEDHEAIARRLRPLVGKAEEENDWVTHDMLTGRLGFHEEAVWMLRALNA